MLHTKWADLPNTSTCYSEPAVIDELDPNVFNAFNAFNTCNVLDMPIRLARDGTIALPMYLEQYRPIVDRVIEHESWFADNNEHNMYITVDTRDARPNKTQRRPGAHLDAYVPQPDADETITHTYIAYSALPTEFFPEPFTIDRTLSCDQLLASFDSQLDARAKARNCTVSNLAHRYPPNLLLMLTPMVLHRAAINSTDQPVRRTFVKISVSKKKYNREGNTRNVLLDYDWVMAPRSTYSRNHPFTV